MLTALIVPVVVPRQVGLGFERLAGPVHDLDVVERSYERAQRAPAEQLRGLPKRCRPGHVSRGLVDVAGIRQRRFAFVGRTQAAPDERVQEGDPPRLAFGLPVSIEVTFKPDLRTNGLALTGGWRARGGSQEGADELFALLGGSSGA
jgi:hypothetical protein